jgi:hypothetical protein
VRWRAPDQSSTSPRQRNVRFQCVGARRSRESESKRRARTKATAPQSLVRARSHSLARYASIFKSDATTCLAGAVGQHVRVEPTVLVTEVLRLEPREGHTNLTPTTNGSAAERTTRQRQTLRSNSCRAATASASFLFGDPRFCMTHMIGAHGDGDDKVCCAVATWTCIALRMSSRLMAEKCARRTLSRLAWWWHRAAVKGSERRAAHTSVRASLGTRRR